MFEDDKERNQKIVCVQNEILEHFRLQSNNLLKIFYNRNSFRLRKFGFTHLKNVKHFYEVTIQVDNFKMMDLIKISKLNNDIFYIDVKKAKIYTCDQSFSHWCAISDGDINSIRFSA